MSNKTNERDASSNPQLSGSLPTRSGHVEYYGLSWAVCCWLRTEPAQRRSAGQDTKLKHCLSQLCLHALQSQKHKQRRNAWSGASDPICEAQIGGRELHGPLAFPKRARTSSRYLGTLLLLRKTKQAPIKQVPAPVLSTSHALRSPIVIPPSGRSTTVVTILTNNCESAWTISKDWHPKS